MILLNGCTRFNHKENTAITSSLPKVNNTFQPTIVWKNLVGSGPGKFFCNLHLTWQNNLVFAADRCGVIKAFDLHSGKEKWSTDLSIHLGLFSRHKSAQLSGGLTATSNHLYVSSELAKVYALNIQNGHILWESTVMGEALSTPIVSDGVVLIHTSNGMLQALNEIDGTVQWIVYLDVPMVTIRGTSAPAIAFGAAIVGGDDGLISAIMIKNGQFIWQQRISHLNNVTAISRINDVQTTPVIINGIVYALAYNGNFVALDLRSGQIIWSREIGASTNHLLVNNRCFYLIDQSKHSIIAVDINGGIILWCQNELTNRNLTSPVLYSQYIIIGDSEGYLHWINANDGCLVTKNKIHDSGILTMLIVTGNQLIVQAINGEILSLKL